MLDSWCFNLSKVVRTIILQVNVVIQDHLVLRDGLDPRASLVALEHKDPQERLVSKVTISSHKQ